MSVYDLCADCGHQRGDHMRLGCAGCKPVKVWRCDCKEFDTAAYGRESARLVLTASSGDKNPVLPTHPSVDQ